MLSHSKIQYGLQWGRTSVENNILKPLKLYKRNYSYEELQKKIRQDIVDLGFEVKYSDSLIIKEKNKIVPAFIELKGSDRKNGGIIKLNKKYPKNLLREALFHEYAHIKDEKLPILTTDKNALNSKATYEKFYMEYIEYFADMIAYTLMMPPEHMISDLSKNAYNINKVLKIYNNIEFSSVLQWIALINPFPCHFVSIVYEKDDNGKDLGRVVYDNSYYDHQVDPRPFDIDATLANKTSAAAVALENKKPAHKASIVNGTEYYCFAYYESDLSDEVIKNTIPTLTSGHYDRLLVIGWKKDVYHAIHDEPLQMHKSSHS